MRCLLHGSAELDADQRNVIVGRLVAAPAENIVENRLQAAIDRRRPRAGDRIQQPRRIEQLLMVILRLDQTVGIEEQAVAGRQRDGGFLDGTIGEPADGEAAGGEANRIALDRRMNRLQSASVPLGSTS